MTSDLSSDPPARLNFAWALCQLWHHPKAVQKTVTEILDGSSIFRKLGNEFWGSLPYDDECDQPESNCLTHFRNLVH